MKNKLLLNFFSSGLQAIAVQILGLVFFYFISLYLSKDSFGSISWANAVSMFLTTLLSCGMEQVVTRRIAASKSSDWAAGAYFIHALVGSIAVLAGLYIISASMKNSEAVKFLPWFFAAQAIIFIGSPLKQYLNAKERFMPYGVIAFVSNLAKVGLAYMLYANNTLTIEGVALVLIVCAVFELAALLTYLFTKTDFKFRVRFSAYGKLIKESLPQYVSVIFDSSLSRMDWILLGILSTQVATADYSFAYRAYELAKLPVLVVAPLILPKFARLLSSNNKPDSTQISQINQFLSIELFVAIGIPLCLNILWTPVISTLTHGKYGVSDAGQFMILSVCVPFQFLINLLWTISFSGRKYKAVSTITIICAVMNLVLNVILIPKFGGIGAAWAFLITTLVQSAGYYRLVNRDIISLSLRPLFILMVLCAASYLVAIQLPEMIMIRLSVAVVMYVGLAFLFRQIGRKQLSTALMYFKR